jgi:hypothetical protein
MKPPAVSFDQTSDLAARTVHDTALYDPAAHDDQIVAMFETTADAQAALDRLSAEGIGGDAEITDRTGDGANAGVNSEGGNTGFWGSLKGLFAPDDEVHGLAEGVRRGHALLVLHPALEHRGRVIELLEASGPIDFDARLEQWRTAGWENLRAQEAATMGAAAGNGVPEGPARDRIGVRDTTRGGERVRSYFAPRSTSET